ncbi:MAG TPA: hypothetical protein VFA18_00520, partial [Gemmataceae bacterium]|nr:hypothetical protein [Gemmataceae bacterium]
MFQHWFSVSKGFAAALMVVLATVGMSRAQSGAAPPNVPRGVDPYGQYPHAWRYYDYPYAGVGAPLMNPPIFMTSINYPGVYGAFIYGPGGSMWPVPGPHETDYQAAYGPSYAPVIPNDTRAH